MEGRAQRGIMASQDGILSNKAPFLYETNYTFWKMRMRIQLMSLSVDIQLSMMDGYQVPSTPPIDVDGRKDFVNNAKAMNVILCGHAKYKFVKVMQCGSTKEIWNKLKRIYEGDEN